MEQRKVMPGTGKDSVEKDFAVGENLRKRGTVKYFVGGEDGVE